VTTALQDRLQTTLGTAYQVERELAPGGMSRLFLATERALDRKVVVKLLPPEFATEHSAQRFQREMLVTAKLQHAHILPVLTAGARDGLLYYVTPYVAGDSLRNRIASEGALPLNEVISLLREVAEALAFAHARSVVHRDLKPDNIFLQHGHAILADFGIARAVEQATRGTPTERLTRTGLGLGTPGYMSPEQLAGDPDVDARADIYAMGVVAYEMLSGHPPFPGRSPAKLIVAHMTEKPEPVTTYRTDAPPELSELIVRCLQKDPADRWQTVEELMSPLQELSASQASRGGTRVTNERPVDATVLAAMSRMRDSLRMGLQAYERSDWHEAFDALSAAEAAGALSPEDLERLADAAWWIGKSEECIKMRERVYALYLASGNTQRAAAVAIAVAEDYFHKLAQSVAHGWLQRAERHLEGLPECNQHGWMARSKAMLALGEEKDMERAWTLAGTAIEIGRRQGDRDLQMLALQDRGRMLVTQGRVTEGMAAIDEAMAASASGQIGARTTGRIYCNMMSTCERLADYRRAREWNEAARQWCEPHSDSGYPGICRVHRAELLRLNGSWPEAEVEAKRASVELEGFLSDVAAEAYYELGELRRLMGDLSTADGLFRRAHELGRDPVPGLALLRQGQGRIESARALLERALSEPSLSQLDRAKLLPAQVEVAIEAGATDVAHAAAQELTAIADTYGSPALVARAAYARGLVELSQGRAAPAAASLRRAWRLSKECDLPYEAARARVSLAQAYRACGNADDAELELQAAVISFERLGAAAAARTTAELLGTY
jgi:serine/threonine protein kinase/tetratricopeptide (TPR) repeat protein